MTTEHPDKFSVARAMHRYGGDFARRLASAYFAADPDNRARIEAAWPEYFVRYARFLEPHTANENRNH